MKHLRFLFLGLLLSLLPVALFAQEALPSGYANIRLGMSLEEVKAALKKDPQFGYRGDRDVSLLPGDARVLIETDSSRNAPHSFLDRCWFQFYEEKLCVIIINVKTSRMDHYSIFSKLCGKYGNPATLNPEKSEWVSDTVIMSLEKPLTLKYIDKAVFDKLQNQSQVNKSIEETSRERFLEGL